jgi:hypothetical protein
MRHTLVYALFVTIVLSVWAVAYQFACDRELEVAQRSALVPTCPEEIARVRAPISFAAAPSLSPSTAPTTSLTPDEFELLEE